MTLPIDPVDDVVFGEVRGAIDVATSQVQAAGQLVQGGGQAVGDLAGAAGQVVHDGLSSYADAGQAALDGLEGDPTGFLRAGGDLVMGSAKETADLVEGVAHAAGDIGTAVEHAAGTLITGAVKGAGDVVGGVLKDFEDVTKGAAQGVHHALESVFGGGESKAEILKKFGSEDPAQLKATEQAQANGKAALQGYASALNSGDAAAVSSADQLLEAGAAGLDYFTYFLPAYNLWTGANVDTGTLRAAYEQESGLSFAAYQADAALLGTLAQQLTGEQQALQTAYNQLVPNWQGPAAANFEAKAAVFFRGADDVQQQVAGSGTAVAALTAGLQQIVLAKAEAVSALYADTLAPGIDGAMAVTIVEVAQNKLGDDMRRVVLGIFHLAAHGRHCWDSDGYFSDDCLDDPSRQAAQNAAAAWCNNTLVPQTEARLKILTETCAQTKDAITQAFARIVADLQHVRDTDPFGGMTTASAPTGPGTPTPGSPTPGPPTPGPPTPGSPTPGSPTPGFGGTTPAGYTPPPTPSTPTPPDAASAPGRPAGLPAGAGWIPAGVPLPTGWSENPATGEITPPSATTSTGQDITKNPDGSVSVGADHAVTIGKAGKDGAFHLTETDPDGTTHTYAVHFDKHGNPVVTEVAPPSAAKLDLGSHATAPAGVDFGHPLDSAAGFGGGGAGASSGSSLSAPTTVGAEATDPASAAPPSAAAANGEQAGASGGHAAGGFGGVPMGMGRGMGGGQQEEARRKYPQRGDVVGEDELAEWDQIGPVIGG